MSGLVLWAAFWSSCALVAYTYAGYPALTALIAWLRPRPIRWARTEPSVTLIIAAYNEELTIAEKLENTLRLRYPEGRLQVLVAADGSNDRTAEIVQRYAGRGIELLHAPERQGKTAAINRAVAQSWGQILVFSDANTTWESDTISVLVRSFADRGVGGVTGRKVVREAADREATRGETAYWGYEAQLKTWESAIASIVTADGEIFAMRRSLYDFPPAEIVHDDMYLTVSLVKRGYRVVYEQAATSVEHASRSMADEFHLKVRYASAGYQIVSRFPRFLLTPTSWFAVEFCSHKLLRWLAPVFLLVALASSAVMPGVFYRSVSMLGAAILLAAALAWCFRRMRLPPPLYFVLYFVVMNVAALYGLGRSLAFGQTTHWRKAAR